MTIPKIIHYCWFGRNPKPRLAEKCILSWKKFCPDYEIMEWNEDNFDLSAAPLYVRQAYEAKKWAFVTDYVRLKVVYDNGGIYMDTDVELLKAPDALLDHQAYFGYETQELVTTGLGFGAEKKAPIIREMMDLYQDIPFLLSDGSYDLTPCPRRNSQVLRKAGLRSDGSKQILPGNILILPRDYFCPLDYLTGKCRTTPNTVSIHWYSSSWFTKAEWKAKRRDIWYNRTHWITRIPNKVGTAVFGKQRYEKIRDFIKGK